MQGRSLALLAAAVLFGGCTDFDERWLVDEFRVLAVRAVDGPEEFVEALVLFDPELLDQLSALEGVEDLAELDLDLQDLEDQATFLVVDSTVDYLIEPLVIDPAHPEGPFRLRARACPWTETYRCDDFEDQEGLVVEVVQGIEAIRSEDLTFFFNPSIDFLNAAVAADPYKGFGGLHMLIDIDIASPSGQLRVAKTVSAQPEGLDQLFPIDDVLLPNRNPRLCGLRATYPNGGALRMEDPRDDDEELREVWRQKNNVSLCDEFELTDHYITWEEQLPVIAGSQITLRPLPPLDRDGQLRAEEELYYTLSLPSNGEPPALVRQAERLEIDVYVSGGSLDDDRAFTRSVFGAQVSPQFVWTVPETLGHATLWFVLRDNRGGVSWMERTVDVVHAPPPEAQ